MPKPAKSASFATLGELHFIPTMNSAGTIGTVNIRLDEDVQARWDRLARDHAFDREQIMGEALVEKLEELEDFYTVKARLAEPFSPVPDEEVWKRLGLAD